MAILSKGCKSDNFDHATIKLSFTNILGLRLNFAECEYFLESNSPDILSSFSSINHILRLYARFLILFNLT